MKNFSQYILEKLHLNKDFNKGKTSHDDFGSGDLACFLYLYLNNEWDKDVHLCIYPPFKIKSVENKKIVYQSPFNGNDIDFEYYDNSKGYMQKDSDDDRASKKRNYAHEILVNPYQYIEIINMILDEKIFNPKYYESAKENILNKLDKDYFDNLDMEELKSKKLFIYDHTTNFGVIGPFKRPKELKEVIDKYYEDFK